MRVKLKLKLKPFTEYFIIVNFRYNKFVVVIVNISGVVVHLVLHTRSNVATCHYSYGETNKSELTTTAS